MEEWGCVWNGDLREAEGVEIAVMENESTDEENNFQAVWRSC